ncbi:hypothetical protein J6590_057843 [Homalodisca vitripennis]|nr:hypothetical protein J6590_057843 [Homalodisca vitripennis]
MAGRLSTWRLSACRAVVGPRARPMGARRAQRRTKTVLVPAAGAGLCPRLAPSSRPDTFGSPVGRPVVRMMTEFLTNHGVSVRSLSDLCWKDSSLLLVVVDAPAYHAGAAYVRTGQMMIILYNSSLVVVEMAADGRSLQLPVLLLMSWLSSSPGISLTMCTQDVHLPIADCYGERCQASSSL